MSRTRTVVVVTGIVGGLLATVGVVLGIAALAPTPSGADTVRITTGAVLFLQNLPSHRVAFQVATGPDLRVLAVSLAAVGVVLLLVAAGAGLRAVIRLQRDSDGLV